jgi:hypothetical protein
MSTQILAPDDELLLETYIARGRGCPIKRSLPRYARSKLIGSDVTDMGEALRLRC